MRWQVVFLVAVLVAPGLAGCLTPDRPDPSETVTEGYGLTRIYVKRPLHLDQYPEIWSLDAVPRLVAFMAADNATRERISELDDDDATGADTVPGYTDLAEGWSAEWARSEHDADDHPEEAVQNWMRDGLWYEGEVPVGNYSVIRIEFVDLQSAHRNGAALDIRAIGDRISIGPPPGQQFEVQAGKVNSFVATSLIERQSDSVYEIR